MKEDLILLLTKVNHEFSGKLISSSIENYVSKLIDKSKIFVQYRNGDLVGFIAFYCNNNESKTGFLSMLVTDKAYRSIGIAKQLILDAEAHLRNLKFINFDLEVLKANSRAIKFYNRMDFKLLSESKTHYLMRKHL